MIDTAPYVSIELDDMQLRPPSESPMPDKVLSDLCLILSKELAFLKIKVVGEDDMPENLTVTPERPVMLVQERSLIPIDLGGSKGTFGVRSTMLFTLGLHVILSSVQVPRKRTARLARNIPIYILRALKANGYLPDATGKQQLTQPLNYVDEGLHPYPFGSDPSGRTAIWRSREGRIEATLIYWTKTNAAGVGSGRTE